MSNVSSTQQLDLPTGISQVGRKPILDRQPDI